MPSGTGNVRDAVAAASEIAEVVVASGANPIGTIKIGSAFVFPATGFVIAVVLPDRVVYVFVTSEPSVAVELVFTWNVAVIWTAAV
jgi:hypothetical protein